MRLIDADWLLDVVENIIDWDTERDRNRIIHQVRELTPTVDAKPHWIPVKKRNPIEYDTPTEFLVTLEDPSGERYIELLMWDGCEWDEIYTDDNELGVLGQDRVIAWCEPIEPYKGVTE